jgi:SAM-dependent methyltransferase
VTPGPPRGPELGSPDEYDVARGGDERGERFARMLHPLFSASPPGGLTLEVGAGTGMVARHLTDLGRRVMGVDRSHDMVRKAQTRIPGRVAVGDATRLPIRDAAVDDAYAVWLLHLADPRAVLEEVARVLRPGGRFLVVPVGEGRPGDPPVRTIPNAMTRRLRGGAGPPDAPDRVLAHAAGLPLRSHGVVEGERQVFETTPRTAADLIERKVWFVVRGLPDDVWAEVVAPTVEALRALPGQDEPVRYETFPRVLVLERTELGTRAGTSARWGGSTM